MSLHSWIPCVRYQFARCGDLVAPFRDLVAPFRDTSWLSGERVRASALDAYRAKANATHFLAEQMCRPDATGSSGMSSRLSIAVPRERDVRVFERLAAACSVYLGLVMPSFLMR